MRISSLHICLVINLSFDLFLKERWTCGASTVHRSTRDEGKIVHYSDFLADASIRRKLFGYTMVNISPAPNVACSFCSLVRIM